MRFEPHEYQKRAIERLVQQSRTGLFMGMGLGKTVVTLTAVQRLRMMWRVAKVLVIAPKKVAEATWSDEAARWDHTACMRVVAVLGGAEARKRALAQNGDLWVINRENVPWLVDYYRNDWPFDAVVLDESTSFKNPRSQRFKALRKVLPRIRWLVELTGTPAPNSLEDVWAQVYLLDGGERLGRTLTSFRAAYFAQDYARPGQLYRTYTPMPGAEEAVRQKISDICVSMKAEDYLELPDYIEDVVPVALDEKSSKQYHKMERDMLLEVDGATITASSAAVLNGKLLQLCSGAIYDEEHNAVPVHNCKVEAFVETVERLGGEHALVFYWFQHEQERLVRELEKSGLRVRVYRDGGDAAAWNAGEVDLLLAHPASCGYGLNLQKGGSHMIWYSLPNWTLELYQQAIARLLRQGQERTVVSHILAVHGGVDENMIAALHEKEKSQDYLLAALRERVRKEQNYGETA